MSGWIDFSGDDPTIGTDTSDRGVGIVVSGDGCRVLGARTELLSAPPSSGRLSPARPSSLTLEDRCAAPGSGEVVVSDLDEAPTRMAMSYDGREAVVGIGPPGGSTTIRHLDIGTIASSASPTDLQLPSDIEAVPVDGLDISDLGDVVVTIGYDDQTRFDVVVWNPENGDTEDALEPRRPSWWWCCRRLLPRERADRCSGRHSSSHAADPCPIGRRVALIGEPPLHFQPWLSPNPTGSVVPWLHLSR